MNVGILGSGLLSNLVGHRLSQQHDVHVLDSAEPTEVALDGTASASSLEALARWSQVIVVCADDGAAVEAALIEPGGLIAHLAQGSVVVDLMPGDPAAAERIARAMAGRGVTYLDAPIHCELLAAFPSDAVMMCGASASSLGSVLTLLGSICTVVCMDKIGGGRLAYFIVAAIAASNRAITYEACGMGLRNGLSMQDMATVLNRCSGASSATSRVLPAATSGERTADRPLAAVVEDLRMSTISGAKLGAPMLIANLVHGLLADAAGRLPADASLHETSDLLMVRSSRSLQGA